jgi:hypothetical protein
LWRREQHAIAKWAHADARPNVVGATDADAHSVTCGII